MKIQLLEALELRREINETAEFWRTMLKHSPKRRELDFDFGRSAQTHHVPAEGFDPKEARRRTRDGEEAWADLNDAIQRANARSLVRVGDDEMPLLDVLARRRRVRARLMEARKECVKASRAEVLHREGGDVALSSEEDDFVERLEEVRTLRREFRTLNLAVRQAQHVVVVELSDERWGDMERSDVD